MWFPVLYAEGVKDGEHWRNVLDLETAAIYEYAPPGVRMGDTVLEKELTRAVFLRERQPLTKKVAYRCVGVYRQTAEEGDVATYSRVAESLKMLR